MKKFFLIAACLFLLLSLVIPVSANTAENPLVVDLVAGKNQDAGDIKVWDDGVSLYVLYETVDPWCLTETHLAVASTLNEIPQRNGNPVPGQFPYKNSHKCTSSFLYTIPLESSACELYIAAHAVVQAPGSTETAWGGGKDFPGKNWGTYSLYKTNQCGSTPTPSQTHTATPTNTPTGTPPTNTPTPTDTATATPTNTPTGTPPTNTSTPTNTATATSPSCQPMVVNADFSKIGVGQSIEGVSAVASGLKINAKGTAVKLLPNMKPSAYVAHAGGATIINGFMASNGGFSDLITADAIEAPLYNFTFATGMSVSNFSLHMLDFGDWNPTNSTDHHVIIRAYDSLGNVIAKQELSYITPPALSGRGDASADPGQPGNWTWNLSGHGIVKVVLRFGVGYDPNTGFDTLSFTTECP